MDGIANAYAELVDSMERYKASMPSSNSTAQRPAAEESNSWRYYASDGKPIGIRKAPDINADRTGVLMESGEVFQVSEEVKGKGDITFLKLADGRGWLFDSKPDTGVLCRRLQLQSSGLGGRACGLKGARCMPTRFRLGAHFA